MAHRTAWHVLFGALLRERVPHWIEVRPEVPLGDEPQRADFLLLRKSGPTDPADSGHVFRNLWHLLSTDTLVEFKSASRPFRQSDLVRLLGYGLQYLSIAPERAVRPRDLSMLMVVPEINAAFQREIAAFEFEFASLHAGYYVLGGFACPIFVAVIDDIADAEDDDLLRIFGRGTLRSRAAGQWLNRHVATREFDVNIEELEGYDEVVEKFVRSLPVEQRLAGLAPEQRLAGLAPEQRLAGIPAAERVAGLNAGERLTGLTQFEVLLALPLEVVAALSEDFVASLPEEVAAELRAKRARR